MSYATRGELNLAFFYKAKIKDDEATDLLLIARKTVGNHSFMKQVTKYAAEDRSIGIAQKYIWSNVLKNGKADGFKNLKDLYDMKMQGYSRIKELTIESQYIEFYDLYKDDFEAEFDKKTYDQAVILMADWI